MLRDQTPAWVEYTPTQYCGTILVPVEIDHGDSCGERVDCPKHGDHGLAPYHPAERQRRASGVYVLCHRCRAAWHELAA